MKNIIFIVDSSTEIGTGHTIRCLTLAKQFFDMGKKIVFFSRRLKGNINDVINKNGFELIEFEETFVWNDNSENVIEKINLFQDTELIVIDHYHIDAKLEKALKKQNYNILIIDDLANRKHVCDCILDQNYYHDFEKRYDNLVSNTCLKLLGPKYILFREEFVDKAQNRKTRSGEINKILIFFGGSDPSNETKKALEAIKEAGFTERVIVVVGQSNPNKEEIESICSLKKNWHYYCQVNNMAEIMFDADFSIGAGGATSWERILLGLPTIATIIADNQIMLTEHIHDLGLLMNLGNYSEVTVKKIAEAVEFFMNHPNNVVEMSQKAIQFIGVSDIKESQAKTILWGIENARRF
ncbi:MAG: pseudaminic acid biosynthesis-associated protein PseG [Bacillales bacterium]|nr:pseudaminic acid biosynthesis-associated protein PseG [Bacillales bacterium]